MLRDAKERRVISTYSSPSVEILICRDIDLFEFLDLREFLESRLNAKVDLVMESALKPAIGRRILSEVEYV
jgi:hypothetical protein